MSFSYSASALGVQLNYARFLLGDVASDTRLLEDEEITGLISMHGFNEAVAQCAESCITRVAQQPDRYKDEAGVEAEWKVKLDGWIALAKRMRAGQQTEAAIVTREVHGRVITNPDTSRMGL